MKTIYLKEFIKTGKFDNITIGSTKDEIIETLGNKFGFGDFGEIQIIKYGWYEFFYWAETGKVHGIQNDHLQADCVNHSDMIGFKSRKWTLDKWFLQVGQNITFKEIRDILTEEEIPFIIQQTFHTTDENVIKCLNSNIIFDFCSEYNLVELNEKGKFKKCKEMKVENEDDFVLNGIRLFEQ